MFFGSVPSTKAQAASRSILTFTDEEQQALRDASRFGLNQVYSDYRQLLRSIGTPEAQTAMNLASWYSKFLSKVHERREADDCAYAASMFCPKPDPVGRHALVNIHAKLTPDNAVEWNTVLYLAGATNHAFSSGRPFTGACLGVSYTHDREIGGVVGSGQRNWMRAHSVDGVSYAASATDSGPGLGFVLYSGAALVSRIFYGATGCYSYATIDREGNYNYRSPSADAFWSKQVQRKFAKKLRNFMRKDHDTSRFPPPAYTVETINADDVMKTGLVVFLTQPASSAVRQKHLPMGPKQVPGFTENAAASFDSYPGTPGEAAEDLWAESMRDSSIGGTRGEHLIESAKKYGIYFKDGTPTYPLPQRGIRKKAALRLELLKRAYHGESPTLTFLIMETLALADSTAAVDYATRPDIARMIAASQPAKALLQRLQQRTARGMDGLAGLSDYELGEIGQAVTYAGAGRMPLDMDADNPLHLPAMPAAIKQELEQYGD